MKEVEDHAYITCSVVYIDINWGFYGFCVSYQEEGWKWQLPSMMNVAKWGSVWKLRIKYWRIHDNQCFYSSLSVTLRKGNMCHESLNFSFLLFILSLVAMLLGCYFAVKVKLSSLQTAKTLWGCGCKGRYFCSRDTRVASPMLGSLHPQESPDVHFVGGWGGSRVSLDMMEWGKISNRIATWDWTQITQPVTKCIVVWATWSLPLQ